MACLCTRTGLANPTAFAQPSLALLSLFEQYSTLESRSTDSRHSCHLQLMPASFMVGTLVGERTFWAECARSLYNVHHSVNTALEASYDTRRFHAVFITLAQAHSTLKGPAIGPQPWRSLYAKSSSFPLVIIPLHRSYCQAPRPRFWIQLKSQSSSFSHLAWENPDCRSC